MSIFVMRVLLLIFTATFCGVALYCAFTNNGNFYVQMTAAILQATLFGFTLREMIFKYKTLNGVPFPTRLNLAQAIIAQLKAGEWKPTTNKFFTECYELERNGKFMWVANGAWGLTIDKKELLGEILKSYVWHKAVKQIVTKENDRLKPKAVKHDDVIKDIMTTKTTLKVVK